VTHSIRDASSAPPELSDTTPTQKLGKLCLVPLLLASGFRQFLRLLGPWKRKQQTPSNCRQLFHGVVLQTTWIFNSLLVAGSLCISLTNAGLYNLLRTKFNNIWHLYTAQVHTRSRDSSVTIVTSLRAERPRNCPVPGWHASSFRSIQTGSAAHPASYSVGARGSFPGVKWPCCEAEANRPPSSASVANKWSYTSILPTCPLHKDQVWSQCTGHCSACPSCIHGLHSVNLRYHGSQGQSPASRRGGPTCTA
jgi:hypothetical protein